MNRNKVYAKSKENQMIIKALNMYGRVPETWELLKEIERLNNIIKQQDTRNSRQRIANRKLQEENNLLKQIIGNDKKYSYGIRMGSDKE